MLKLSKILVIRNCAVKELIVKAEHTFRRAADYVSWVITVHRSKYLLYKFTEINVYLIIFL